MEERKLLVGRLELIDFRTIYNYAYTTKCSYKINSSIVTSKVQLITCYNQFAMIFKRA